MRFVIATVILIAAATLGVGIVHANPSQFVTTVQTATASSSPVYMTPGTATSTVVYDTYQQSTGNFYTVNAIELLTQLTASSTSSQINIAFEYSNGYSNGNAIDCTVLPAGCDWYQDTATNVQGYATSTLPFSLNQIPQYQWRFASSTIGQQAPGVLNNRDTRAVALKVPTRYVRVIYTCAIGGANCGVWGQFVPAKEVR